MIVAVVLMVLVIELVVRDVFGMSRATLGANTGEHSWIKINLIWTTGRVDGLAG